MTKKLFLLLALLLPLPALATLTQVQAVTMTTGGTCGSTSGTTCSTGTISSTSAGNLGILVGMFFNSSASSPTGAACTGSWTRATGTNVTESSTRSVDIWYCLNLTAGNTSISYTVGNNTARGVVFIEISCDTSCTFALDDSGGAARTSATTSLLGIGFTLTGTNDFLVQSIFASSGSFSSIDQGYTRTILVGQESRATLINSTTATQPTWTWTTSQTAAVNGAAFKEVLPSTGRLRGSVVNK